MMAEDHYSSSPEVSSSYAAARRKVVDVEEMEEEELREEEELELGLSLGAKKNTKANNGGRSGPWREYCRILTAKDFPSMVASRVSPNSSSASSSFSLVGRGAAAAAADDGDGGGSNVPSQVVGWPPIRSYRINNLFHQPKDNYPVNNLNNQDKKPVAHILNIHHKCNRNSNVQDIVASNDHEKKARSRFVKVNMDGVPIGRKVDLNAHQSYETLALVLEDMFQSPTGFKTPFQSIKVSKLLDGSSELVLTYEDKDGDWMLVGDVPWGMFLSSVRRLRIMRTSDGNGLAPRFHPTIA